MRLRQAKKEQMCWNNDRIDLLFERGAYVTNELSKTC